MHSMFLPFSLVEQLYLKHFLSFNQFQVFVSQFCQRFFLINSLLSSTAFWTAKQFLEHLVLFNSSIQYFFLCFWTHFMEMTEIHILGCIFSFLVLWNNNVLLSSKGMLFPFVNKQYQTSHLFLTIYYFDLQML